MLAYLAVPTKLFPPLTGICCPVFKSLYLLASPKSMIYTILALSFLPIIKLLALISRWTNPLRCICSSLVIICIPILSVVANENFLPLRGFYDTKVEISLQGTVQVIKWSCKTFHDRNRFHNRWVCTCHLNYTINTNPLKELIQFNFVLQLSITLSFLFLSTLKITILAA